MNIEQVAEVAAQHIEFEPTRLVRDCVLATCGVCEDVIWTCEDPYWGLGQVRGMHLRGLPAHAKSIRMYKFAPR